MTFRMPAEWEPHAATWLAWPHRESDWPGKFAPIPWVYGEIVRTLARFELVHVIVRDEAEVRDILDQVHANWSNIQLHRLPTDRSWMRDSGAIFVRNSDNGLSALDWRFNGWAKYEDWKLDDKVPELMASVAECPRLTPMFGDHRIVLEGGSIDVNGAGALLTTEECLLSKTQERNPPMSRMDYEQVFREYLGITETLWLDRGIAGDDTHGHVDDLARFVDAKTIVMVEEHDPSDENFEPLRENWQLASRMPGYRFVPLPMPRPVIFDGQRLPASYANFYIANSVVIVPTFNDPADRIALNTIAELFPKRTVVGISAIDLIYGLGTLHCLSQQQPA
jgi:agmatine deiminase